MTKICVSGVNGDVNGVANSKNDGFKAMVARAKAGDVSARNKILEENLGLINKIASETNVPGCDFEDLVIVGCIRFLEIINGYDPEVASLSTYIWQPLSQAMKQAAPDFKKGLSKFKRDYEEVVEYLKEMNGRKPDDDEVASFMGLSKRQFRNRRQDLEDRILISLDKEVGSEDDDSATLGSIICSPTAEDPLETVLREEKRRYFRRAWWGLSEEDRKALTLRFNADGERMSLREAEKRTGINRGTINYRELKAKEHFNENLERMGYTA